MTDQPCVRGCKHRGLHYSNCSSFGPFGDDKCRGCVAVDAEQGLLCGRCFRRIEATLRATPDLLAHIRSLCDPLKATQYDKEPGGGGGPTHAPPPVPVDLLDAGDAIATILWSARLVSLGVSPVGGFTLTPGTSSESVWSFATEYVDDLLAVLHDLAELPEVRQLGDAVIGQPADKDGWTIAKALRRWSTADEPWWAAQPCPVPSCSVRAVKVTPPEMPGDETRYRCEKCGWEAPDDVDGFWADVYSRREGKAA